MRHVLIGGNGFVGRMIVDQIIAEGEDEAVVVDLPESLSANPIAHHHSITSHAADISVPGSLDGLSLGTDDVVHHLATMLITPNKPRFGRDEFFRKCAVHGTRELINWMESNDCRKLVFWSTDMVYGPVLEVPRTEQHPKKPFGAYGRSKVEAEKLVAAEVEKGNLDCSIFRPRLILGAGRVGIFKLLFDAVDAGRPVPLIGSGSTRFQFVAVHDCATASLLAAKQGCPNAVFNLGTDESPKVIDLMNQFIREIGSSSRIVRTPAWLVKGILRMLNILKISPMDPEQFEIADLEVGLDTTAVKRDLGWEPTSTDIDLLVAAYRAYADTKSAGRG